MIQLLQQKCCSVVSYDSMVEGTGTVKQNHADNK